MNRELISVIDEIGRQKGIDKTKVIGAIEAALQTAAKKRFGQAENIQVEIDSKTGAVTYIRTSAYGAYARFWNRDTRIPCTKPPTRTLA